MSKPFIVEQREKNNEPFDLYFAGSRNPAADDWLAANKCPRLFSQLNDRSSIKAWNEYEVRGKLFVDSGAHTAYTTGKEVDTDDLIEYVNGIDEYVEVFAQVDKVPGRFAQPKTRQDWLEAPEISWKNYLYMRPRVKSPHKLMPVFHQGEDFKWLELMLETKFARQHIPYIGLSPTTDSGVKYKIEFIDKCFKIISKSSNPHVKTHALGMTSLYVLEMYPFYSADATTWLRNGALGRILTPWGIYYVGPQDVQPEVNIKFMPESARYKIAEYAAGYGFTLDELRDDYSKRMILNAMHLQDWANNYKYRGATGRKKLI